MHIDGLGLVERTGFTPEQIKTAYNEMMNFCLFGGSFSTGDLKYSANGMSHFADCAVLFRLDLWVAALSTLALVILYFVQKKYPPKIPGCRYLAGILTIANFIAITLYVAKDFEKAFMTFHYMIFPDNLNWQFNPYTDEIILVLPEEFFRNCAILIVGVMFSLCTLLIVYDRKKFDKTTKQSE